MMTNIVFATRNQGKLREVQEFFAGGAYNVMSLDDIGFHHRIVEDGATFEENAAKKARWVCNACGLIVLADDSGLCIDALDGVPGVASADFLGADTPYVLRNRKILEMMGRVSHRTARFVCVIAIARPGAAEILVREELVGEIARVPAGEFGFGYDPIFYLPQFGQTTAQMDAARKNEISHRGQALRLARQRLDAL